MPELPEVETTRRHIAPVLEGARISAVELGRDRMARRNMRPQDIPERLLGRRVGRVGRRGKFLLIEVEGDLTWVIHLGMSGRMRITSPSDPLDPHTQLVVTTDRGDQVRLIDPRTFGFVAVFTPEELEHDSLAALGPDALEELPDAATLGARLAGRRAPIKALLLDQRILAGLGNIYADEVLFRARVRPTRPGGDLTPEELADLVAAIPEVLLAGVEMGGTSLDDLAYLLPDGRAGEYLDRLMVYGRAGEPCLVCGTPIERVVVAQRSSHFCPTCQR
ncbi:MAG: bifunctional DNA-formamidopyrimidine glycosylase/DNA-(apurinic or apyrimidinic site) lyase [Actinomycetes bacterium]|jgi:formamidopyrimidine-DNA glycosylase|nr:bifunctional DNA-formamidopyrimidine glycosylase/DNA-(apurinic or apyrimidinic site) lyase [Acidimicrobiia bacterium]